MATPPGFEPGLNGPKPLVLPLHHGVAADYIKYHHARRIAKLFGGENPFFTLRLVSVGGLSEKKWHTPVDISVADGYIHLII